MFIGFKRFKKVFKFLGVIGIMLSMMSKAAQKQREYRRRKKADKAVLSVESELYPLADILVDSGLLAEWDADDKKEISRAVSRLLEFVAQPQCDA